MHILDGQCQASRFSRIRVNYRNITAPKGSMTLHEAKRLYEIAPARSSADHISKFAAKLSGASDLIASELY